MKTKVIALFLGLASLTMFAQKDEIKAAEKAVKKQDYGAAVSSIKAAEAMIGSMDAKMKAKFYYIKGQAYQGTKDFQTAADAYNALEDLERKTGKEKYTATVKPLKNQMVQEVYKKASEQYKSKDYANAVGNFYLTYKLSPQDTTFVYNAAISATLNKDYDTALKYYRELLDLGYTGISTMYFATNKETGVKENLGSKENRDIQVKIGAYKDPVQEQTDSKVGDITKNIAYILKEQGKTDEALAAVKKARGMFPDDLNLILTEADIYYQLGDTEKFGELMQQAVKEDPTNPQLFFNLGVINFDQGKKEEARGYYEKAIELKDDYADAYMNLAVLILDEEKAIVEEMNKNLSDFDKYDELLAKQKGVYKKALPFLEKADKFGRNVNTVQTLMNIYSTLEMTEKEKEFSDLYKKLRQ
jgi:tetratricopeptide (TPR) repeat protein